MSIVKWSIVKWVQAWNFFWYYGTAVSHSPQSMHTHHVCKLCKKNLPLFQRYRWNGYILPGDTRDEPYLQISNNAMPVNIKYWICRGDALWNRISHSESKGKLTRFYLVRYNIFNSWYIRPPHCIPISCTITKLLKQQRSWKGISMSRSRHQDQIFK